MNRGVTNASLNYISAAISDLNNAIKLDPNYSQAYRNRGIIHKHRGDVYTACTDWKASHQLGDIEMKAWIDAYCTKPSSWFKVNPSFICLYTNAIWLISSGNWRIKLITAEFFVIEWSSNSGPQRIHSRSIMSINTRPLVNIFFLKKGCIMFYAQCILIHPSGIVRRTLFRTNE